MNIRADFFVKEALLFVLALALGVVIAYHYGVQSVQFDAVEPVDFSWMTVATMVVVFFGFSFAMARFRFLARLVFRTFLMFIVFFGADLFFGMWLGFPWDIVAALAAVVLLYRIGNVTSHNIGIILGIAAISSVIGLSITPDVGLFILLGMSAYDIIAVYRTRHMVALAENMIQSGAIFGFLIPLRWRDFSVPRDKARVGQDFMILGSGDIGVPLLFITSIVTTSLPAALITGLFSVGGLFVTHLLFVNQTERRAMAALPPIATGTILGYLASFFLV